MKSTSAIALVAAFLPAVFASPLHMARHAEAEIEYDVVTAMAVETVFATVYATEGAPTVTYAAAAETTTIAAETTKGRKNNWTWRHRTTSTTEEATSTTAAPYVAPAPVTTSSVEVAPVVVVPTTTSTPEVETPVYTPPYVAPTPTSTYVAPAPAATTAASLPSTYSGDDSYSSANLPLAIIDSTNTYRTMFQAAPVTWNQSLVDMAVSSVAKCDFQHTNAGQNLAAGYGGPESAVGAWGDEYKSFDFSHPDFSESAGHFTQLVWQDTTTVGCAAKKCPTDGSTSASGWYLICNYFPVGNMLGEFAQNVKNKA